MPLHIVRNDITRMEVDAIVNAANETLLGGGGVDGAIHRAAGPRLLAECKKLHGCATGDAKMTHGYRLPAKYVIHTVGPVWHGGRSGEAELLVSCYWKSLHLAKANKCESVAFPLISAGAYGYPKQEAFRIAVNTIQAFLMDNDMTVYLVVFDKGSYFISQSLFDDVKQYIDQHYVDEHTEFLSDRMRRMELARRRSISHAAPAKTTPDPEEFPDIWLHSMDECRAMPAPSEDPAPTNEYRASPARSAAPPKKGATLPRREHKRAESADMWANISLEDALGQLDESFSEMLLRKISEKGMTDPECYKKANVDRKLFSKIRSDKNYKPSKPTAVALCIALELSLPETKELLSKAGIALTHANKFDIIIEYFLVKHNYNIFEINETLLCFDQPLLGV